MDKRKSAAEVVGELADGMTIGIGASRWRSYARYCAPR